MRKRRGRKSHWCCRLDKEHSLNWTTLKLLLLLIVQAGVSHLSKAQSLYDLCTYDITLLLFPRRSLFSISQPSAWQVQTSHIFYLILDLLRKSYNARHTSELHKEGRACQSSDNLFCHGPRPTAFLTYISSAPGTRPFDLDFDIGAALCTSAYLQLSKTTWGFFNIWQKVIDLSAR